LNSPWALVLQPGTRALLIAMAGAHQIWRLDLETSQIAAWAGSGSEGLGDGTLTLAMLAQPSGLATDGTHLFVADSESSSIRSIVLDRRNQRVQTLVGRGLPVFDDIDGFGDEVRLQHCQAVDWSDGKLYIADTYNNKIKVYDPRTRGVETLVGAHAPGDGDVPPRFYQPGGLSMAHPHLYVADTNNHKVRVVDLKEKTARTLEFDGLKPPPTEPVPPSFPGAVAIAVQATKVGPGKALVLDVQLPLETGVKTSTAGSMPYLIETPGRTGLLSGELPPRGGKVAPTAARFSVAVPLARPISAGDGFELKLSVSATLATEGSNVFALKSYVWTIPVQVVRSGPSHIALSGAAR
jgi:hypothetical protein